jgi:hypothetical protein
MEGQFQERIARAKEAARLASIAALSRGSSAAAPAPRGPPPPPPLGFRGPPPPPPPSTVPPHPSDPSVSIPDDVRHRIDRLVEFIARNGPAFEATARERERANPDFAFLHPGAPFHEYFIWKKAQTVLPPPAIFLPHAQTGGPPSLPPRPLVDPILHLSVGAMANACHAARARGLPTYAPLPPDLLAPAPSAGPLINSARLEARLADYYRSPMP